MAGHLRTELILRALDVAPVVAALNDLESVEEFCRIVASMEADSDL